MNNFIKLVVPLLFSFTVNAQTVGLMQNDSGARVGYTLFAPINYTSTYLIDNCGELVHEWESDSSLPGMSVHLLEDGSLLKAVMKTGVFAGPGIGGILEKYDWNGNLTWHYEIADSFIHPHHDIEPLPNGNVLVIAWERKSIQEAFNNGRDTNTLTAPMWPDAIFEFEQIGFDSAKVVWEWHAWDHLVQEFDVNKNNFGFVSQNPHKIDINYPPNGGGGGGSGGTSDWLHFNGIDYNADLDQILISCLTFNEIWVIDHSTSTAEAAGSIGGLSGMGGEVLYRWGNPATYGRGTSTDQKLYSQHDPRWITPGSPNEGKISIFNNGVARPGGSYSSIEIIDPPIQGYNYVVDTSAFMPDTSFWIFIDSPASNFFAPFIGGGQQLDNGNFLICEGPEGRFFEIDKNGDQLWEYICPVNASGPLSQGSNSSGNWVFKTERYTPSYPGFQGKVLAPQGPIELNSIPTDCTIFTKSEDPVGGLEFSIDIAGNTIVLTYSQDAYGLNIYDMTGKEVDQIDHVPSGLPHIIDLKSNGMYLLRFTNSITGTSYGRMFFNNRH